MPTSNKLTYAKNEVTHWPIPNYWDVIALIFVIGIIMLLGWGAKNMAGEFSLGQSMPISLDPTALPYYALRSMLRMLIALGFSLLFTFVFGTWAAKSRQAERIIIPMIDILQSVPVIGFLSITIVGFIMLFPGSLLGPECAAIFAIFVAQVWNMTLSFYQSLKNIPKDLQEAAAMFHLSAWQKFWRIEVPFAMPGLLWNMMMSMSSSWVFLVASEAFPVLGHQVTLPGIGSYIATAITAQNKLALGYVIIAMFLVILLYDQVLFRPLVAWAEKFKAEESATESFPESWLLQLFQSTRLFLFIGGFLEKLGDGIVNFPLFNRRKKRSAWQPKNTFRILCTWLWNTLLIIGIGAVSFYLARFLIQHTAFSEIKHTAFLGSITTLRVLAVILLSSLIWVPIGVWIGLNPRASKIAQPIAQFLAAFPVNLLFPVAVIYILRYHLNVDIWSSPLMILGTQWYILFNVIAGANALPKNLLFAADTLNVRGWLWWKRLVLPGIFPFYITGAITAAGGAWNISIITEALSWGNDTLYSTGLGAYIAKMYTLGNFPNLILGIVMMSLYVLVLNRLVWRPLYQLAEERFQIR